MGFISQISEIHARSLFPAQSIFLWILIICCGMLLPANTPPESGSIMAYTIEKKIFSDALSNTYDIAGENNVHYNMTEYYSEAITDQTHTVLSEQKYMSLYRGLWTLKNMLLTHIPRIIRVEDANGIFAVWESFYGISLKDYMELYNKRVPFRALPRIMPPLLDDCESAHQNGVYFTISPDTIYLTDGGELRLNTMVNPSANVHSVNRGVAQSIFYMLTGFPYGNLQIPAGALIPEPLRELLDGVLGGRLEFGGVGEFHNALRAAVRAAENESPPAGGYNAAYEKRKMPLSAKIAAGIGIGCLFIVMLVMLSLIFSNARAAKYSSLAEADGPAAVPPMETPDSGGDYAPVFNSPSFEFVYFDPVNKNEIYDGLVLQTESALFYRRKSNGSAQLIKEANGIPSVLVSGVLPAFMQSDGESVYFCDGYNNYHIYCFDGAEVRPLLKKTAGFLALYKDFLYYVDDEDNGSIYRLNINTSEITKINDEASAGLVAAGGILYFINIYDDYAIYYIELDSENPSGKPLQPPSEDRVYGYELKNLRGNLLYSKESDWKLYVMTPDNSETPFIYPVSAYVYDIYDNVMYYLDNENYYPHELLIAGGGKDAVMSFEECSYITAVKGGAFFISDGEGYALCRITGGKRGIVDLIAP
jgi:hypothetical protein